MMTQALGGAVSGADKDSESAATDRGTSVAQHNGTMQTRREMDESACQAEQNLPCMPAAIDATN
jgi:hypothetical protein